MNTHDIKLPPLPPLCIAPSVEPVDYPKVAQALMDYAHAAVEADRKCKGEVVVTKTPEGEIIAVTRQDDEGRILSVIAEAESKRRGEPVGYIMPTALKQLKAGGNAIVGGVSQGCDVPIYADPQQVVPLTDEKIRIIWKETRARMGVGGDPVLWFARAIERAHGISAPQPAEPSKNGPRKGDQRIIDGVVWTCTDPEIDRWVTTGSQPAEPIVSDVEAIVRLLESREWAEHVATTPLGQRLETAITVLMGADPQPAEPVKYWLCCGSTDPTHADRKQPDCYDPDKAKFGTAESHKDSPAEPVKRKRRYAQGTALGEFGVIPMCDQVNDEPDEERLAMEAVMESVDPATWPGLTPAQRCALGRFAKPQPAEPQECGCCGRSDGCDPDCDAPQPAEPCVSSVSDKTACESENGGREPQPAEPVKHDLYKTGDDGAPEKILDRNGEVVLDCCKRCGKAEIELSEQCVAEPVKQSLPALHFLPLSELRELAMRDCSKYSDDDLAIAWELFDRLVEGGRITDAPEPVKVPSDLPNALRDLVALWREQQSEYPAGGKQAAAAVRLCANELEHLLAHYGQQAQPVVFTDANCEDRFNEHEANACPYCGGSGHKDDVQPAAIPVGIAAPAGPMYPPGKTLALFDGSQVPPGEMLYTAPIAPSNDNPTPEEEEAWQRLEKKNG